MNAYQQRVVDEKKELDARRERLQHFYLSAEFAKLNSYNALLQGRQLEVMRQYSEILGERIAAFGSQPEPDPERVPGFQGKDAAGGDEDFSNPGRCHQVSPVGRCTLMAGHEGAHVT